MRSQLSKLHIKGSGLECGALNWPLDVEPGVSVKYIDRISRSEMEKVADVPIQVKGEWTVDSAETLDTVEALSQDFLIANHVFEHLENPVLALKNWCRVLKPGGVIFAAIPDSFHTFDRNRARTTFDHLIRDYEKGPNQSAEEHYFDWFTNAEVPLKGHDVEARVAHALSERANIHFHVWFGATEIFDLFHRMKIFVPIDGIETHQNGAEVIVICRKKQ